MPDLVQNNSLELNQRHEQKQLQQLALTQQFQQSLQILQAQNQSLHQLVASKCLANPFVNFLADPLNVASQNNANLPAATKQALAFQTQPQTLKEHLSEQIKLTMRPNQLRQWVEFLVGMLDDNGYLPADKIANWNQAARKQGVYFADALALLQSLDPPGVGAINLSQCLGIQISRDSNAPTLAYLLCTQDIDALAQRKWQQLAEKYHVSVRVIARNFRYIQTLTPAPGAAFLSTRGSEIIPDAVVAVNDGKVEFKLTKATTPTVSFNLKQYEKMLFQAANSAERVYIIAQRDQYVQLANDLNNRKSTLEKIVASICQHQRNFFLTQGKQLAPWLLRNLAAELNLHESTVSRAISGKYLKTAFGTFALRHFFVKAAPSNHVKSESTTTLKQKIVELINAEDKMMPLSDQALADTLARLGWQVSRRTVAKYRLSQAIPKAGARKQEWLATDGMKEK